MFKKLITILLFGLLFYVGTAQITPLNKADSLEVIKLTDSVSYFYTNPLRYKEELPKTLSRLDELLANYKDNSFLISRKLNVLRSYNYFLRRTTNDSVRLKTINNYINLSKLSNNQRHLSVGYRQLATFWRDAKRYPKTYKFIDKSIAISKSANDTLGEIISESIKLKFLFYENLKQKNKKFNDSILQEYFKLYKLSKEYNLKDGQKSVILKILDFNFKSKNYSESKGYLFELERLALYDNDKIALKGLYRKFGTYYKRAENNIKKAIPYYKKSVELNEQLHDTLSLITSYLGLSNTYKALGNHKEAMFYYERYALCLKAKNDVNNYRKVLELESKRDLEEQRKMDSLQLIQKQELIQLETEQNARQKIWVYTIIFLIILFAALLGYLNYRRRLIKKELEVIKLEQRVTQKSEEVGSLLGETVKHLKQKNQIAQNLQQLSKNSSDANLKSLLAELKSEQIEDSKLIALRENIKANTHDFITRLKNEYPALTKSELDVCALIRLNMSKKEIAILRSIKEASVKTARNRIRKKLSLPLEIRLSEFIKNF